MLKAAIIDKLNECIAGIFEDLQREFNIQDGFIEPLSEICLDSCIAETARVMIDIFKEQLIYNNEDGESIREINSDANYSTSPEENGHAILMDDGVSSLIACIKPGTEVEITPDERFPDAERRFVVNEVTESGILYGVTEECDGHIMPFEWISDFRIIQASPEGDARNE